MGTRKDLTGKRFGKLVVESYSHSNNGAVWNCVCDCGGRSIVPARSLNYGSSKSCGCGSTEQAKANCRNAREKKAIGLPHSNKMKDMYRNMLSRCYEVGNKRYENYGGRGIKVCEEWLNSRRNFYKWVSENGYRPGLTLDRIEVDGDYSPDNCRFADAVTQMNNTTRNHFIEWRGKRLTLSQWEKEIGISQYVLYKRMTSKWSVDDVMTRPVRVRKK